MPVGTVKSRLHHATRVAASGDRGRRHPRNQRRSGRHERTAETSTSSVAALAGRRPGRDLPSSTRRAISTAVRTTPQSRAGLFGLPAWRPPMSKFARPRRTPSRSSRSVVGAVADRACPDHSGGHRRRRSDAADDADLAPASPRGHLTVAVDRHARPSEVATRDHVTRWTTDASPVWRPIRTGHADPPTGSRGWFDASRRRRVAGSRRRGPLDEAPEPGRCFLWSTAESTTGMTHRRAAWYRRPAASGDRQLGRSREPASLRGSDGDTSWCRTDRDARRCQTGGLSARRRCASGKTACRLPRSRWSSTDPPACSPSCLRSDRDDGVVTVELRASARQRHERCPR